MSDTTPEPMTDEGLAEIRARFAATEVEAWRVEEVVQMASYRDANEAAQNKANAEFILHAHNHDIPRLLAEVQRLRVCLRQASDMLVGRARGEE